MHKKEESQLLHHVMEISKKEVKATAKKVTDVITLEDTEDSDESDSIKVDGARGHGLDFERPWEEANRTAGPSGPNKPKSRPGPASKTRAANDAKTLERTGAPRPRPTT